MPDPQRLAVVAHADPVVVKVGTRVLTGKGGGLDLARVDSLAEQLAEIGAGSKRRVVLVSSGAVGAGIGRLGLTKRPTDLASLQAVAALGQSRLIEAYNQALEKRGCRAAQVLLTSDDFHDRRRYLNVRNTLEALFEYGAIPIVNENDTVRTDELARNVGDNDRLAAMVTNLLRAPLLILLTDVEGLYDGDPKDPASKIIPTVDSINDDTLGLARATTDNREIVLSLGGMASKLEAARMVTSSGENVILAGGGRPRVLADVLSGELVGTLLLAQEGSVSSRKRWIAWAAHPGGRLTLDDGAVRAVEEHGKSLLSVGIARVEGDFEKGDVVSLVDRAGQEVARGLTNYGARDLATIAGRPAEQVAETLDRPTYTEVVHRNHLTLVRRPAAG
ncbi:MAG: glutamate 5-kinase [Lacipirellulaceae bacterium]